MKIKKLKIASYRTLEDISLEFPTYYTAICGKNDSGKTNTVKAIKSLMRADEPFVPFYREDADISFKNDFTKWIVSDADNAQINFNIDLSVNKDQDAALYQFVIKHLEINEAPENLNINLDLNYSRNKNAPTVIATVFDNKYEDLDAQEVLKRIQTSNSIFFHNSAEIQDPFRFRSEYRGLLGEYSPEYRDEIEKVSNYISSKMRTIVKGAQKDIKDLLGRMNEKYKVGISIPKFELDYFPLNITLGDRKIDVPLSEWGSGTINRTFILLTLFKARQISRSGIGTEKITPIIIIEEPESFLHPSAQAEFGRILQDLSEEFQVQVIVTTHSPYLLSHDKPNANILLEREIASKQLRKTYAKKSSGADWMEPFGLALGIKSNDLQPWKEIFFNKSECIILVEGIHDKNYLELLRLDEHKENRLIFDGEIFPYKGCGNLKNQMLIRFIKDRYNKVFITYDLDLEHEVEKTLKSMKLKKNSDYLGIGLHQDGKMNIEGLLPETVISKVFAENPTLGQTLASGNRDAMKKARGDFKKLCYNTFHAEAKVGNEYYGEFYKLAKKLNRAFAKE